MLNNVILGTDNSMQSPGFRYEIVCRTGVLCFGAGDDFLALIVRAREAKRRYKERYPDWSDLRVRVICPNGQRVSRDDLRAALRAIAAFEGGSARRAAASGTTAKAGSFSVSGDSDFRQAGVVAPPDSLTGETRPIFGDSL